MATEKTKMIRTQISLTKDDYETAKQIAEEQGISLAQVLRNAFRESVQTRTAAEHPMLKFAGALKGTNPNDSVEHDEIIYGKGIR